MCIDKKVKTLIFLTNSLLQLWKYGNYVTKKIFLNKIIVL